MLGLPYLGGVAIAPNVLNVHTQMNALSKWRVGRSNVLEDSANAILAVLGGQFMDTGICTRLASRLTTAGYSASATNFVLAPIDEEGYSDDRVEVDGTVFDWETPDSGWSWITGYGLNNRRAWRGLTTSETLDITPGINTDTYIVYFLKGFGLGQLTLTATDGTPVVVDCDDGESGDPYTVDSVEVVADAASAANVLTVAQANAAVYVLGVLAVPSASQVLIMDGCFTTARATDFAAGDGGGHKDFLAEVGVKLTVAGVGATELLDEEEEFGIPTVQEFEASIAALRSSTFFGASDLLLVFPPPAAGFEDWLVKYEAMVMRQAHAHNTPVYNLFRGYGGTVAGSSAFFSDHFEFNVTGKNDMVSGLMKFLL